MENHPIPQDVTGFQFKLIGNMTVKQFSYLAIGIVLGWVFLQIPVSIFIKLPLSLFFAILGVGLAFFPISGRPMDAMIGNFVKALFRPTQFFYEKTGGQLYFSNTKVPFMPTALPFQQKDKLKVYLEGQLMQKNNASLPTAPPKQSQVPDDTWQSFPPTAPSIDQTHLNIQPKPQPPIVKTQTTFLKPMPVPESPNLITGVTRDPRGNPLSNILVEVKDKEGNPVRAFKTNEVGRFASATPLLNGNYTIEFEDPKGQNKFEKGIVNAIGQIIQPTVAVSIDTREELRRSLFSTNTN